MDVKRYAALLDKEQSEIALEILYQQATRRIYELMDAEPGSPEEAELEALSAIVEEYEERVWGKYFEEDKNENRNLHLQ